MFTSPIAEKYMKIVKKNTSSTGTESTGKVKPGGPIIRAHEIKVNREKQAQKEEEKKQEEEPSVGNQIEERNDNGDDEHDSNAL